ncbi:hypothetical protein BH20ACT1_BH20ACT1_08550 [soil metagenome]
MTRGDVSGGEVAGGEVVGGAVVGGPGTCAVAGCGIWPLPSLNARYRRLVALNLDSLIRLLEEEPEQRRALHCDEPSSATSLI